MPELPEVETIKIVLVSTIKGKEIIDVKIIWSGALNIPAKKFIELIKGAKIFDISRRAKILIITLSNDYSLLIHLKMTGQLLHESRIMSHESREILKNPKYKYARMIFYFKNGGALIFNDLRKFGYIKLIPKEKVGEVIGKEKFGPEPLEKYFTLEKFQEIFGKYPKRRIKQFLMDPTAIAGIGNIYADEICFYAKVNPIKQINNLTIKQVELLFKGIKEILTKAVKLRGSSVENYVDASGRKGDYVKELKVYQVCKVIMLEYYKLILEKVVVGIHQTMSFSHGRDARDTVTRASRPCRGLSIDILH